LKSSVLSDEEAAYYKREAERLSKTGKGVVTCWRNSDGRHCFVTAPWLKNPKGIRDVEEWHVSTIVISIKYFTQRAESE
jgi:hypothetical protein